VNERDDIAQVNKALWKSWAGDNDQYTTPWLDLKRDLLEDFVEGRIEVLPRPYMYVYPRRVLEAVAGKKVLCLATGGGQQSAVFGLLGADVTILDLTDEQLAADREAASHHGYHATTIQGDMRDLSAFEDVSFDLVYQAISIVFVPDVREVYREVSRVLKPGGCYRVGHCLAATQVVDDTTVCDDGYVVKGIYFGGEMVEADGREFRHHLSDVFNGLCELGFRIDGVWEDPRHHYHLSNPEPGTEEHMVKHVQKYFAIMAQKE